MHKVFHLLVSFIVRIMSLSLILSFSLSFVFFSGNACCQLLMRTEEKNRHLFLFLPVCTVYGAKAGVIFCIVVVVVLTRKLPARYCIKEILEKPQTVCI